ncbi:MAG: glycoside hydrolase family 3 C-terminal domain-containing protein [Bacteroidia bacterium]|nr:glycoside hydrolase family 3 C-terminal domain-containing protein [Bacteroidia bacterium]
MKQAYLLLISVFFLQTVFSESTTKPMYKNPSVSIEKRIDDLVSRMTLTEKLEQMTQRIIGQNNNTNNAEKDNRNYSPLTGSFINFSNDPHFANDIQRKAMEQSRLGIPVLLGMDVIHGFRTIFPIPLAQGCTWNPELTRQSSEIAAKEAALSGIKWTFSPMIDVARDPRWGRVAEAYGEDTYSNSQFCVAAVKGYQGERLSNKYSVAACLKHYIGYSLSEGGRDYHSTDVSPLTLWETFMPPYKAGVEAGAQTLMSAFNDITGVPASANHYTLTEVLKNQWKHDGFVVSDWKAVFQLINQGFAADSADAGVKAVNAGVEMDMNDEIYATYLPAKIKHGEVVMSRIDDAVRRILRVKFRLGLFDNPYIEEIPESERYLLSESQKVAEKLAEESMVLLKNEKNLLPLAGQNKKIAVIGPIAKDMGAMMGSWTCHGKQENTITLFEGLANEYRNIAELIYSKGCDFEGTDESDFSNAIEIASKSDVIILCMGEKRDWSGENASRASIALPAIQEKLAAKLKETGKPIVLVLSNGRPLELIRLEPLADAILEVWQPVTFCGNPFAGIVSGRLNPSGRLDITFPKVTGQIPTYYNMRPNARSSMKDWNGLYQDVKNEPMYWFGHGLSYSSFEYSDLKVSKTSFTEKEQLTVEVKVKNSSTVDGQETVFWYVVDPVASISQPIKKLKYFDKKSIKAGQESLFTFHIDPKRDLSYIDGTGKSILEKGEFYIQVNDERIKLVLK